MVHIKQSRSKFNFFLPFLLSTFLPIQALLGQTIKPATFNNGGGTMSAASIKLEWSLSESASIGTFTNGTSMFTLGVLQPTAQVITGLSEKEDPFLGNEIQVSPNPTTGPLNITTHLTQAGKMTLRILNSTSKISFQNTYYLYPNKQNQKIAIDQFHAGIYYVYVLFEAQKGMTKSGIYKIIKL